jgi:hypothetical protein
MDRVVRENAAYYVASVESHQGDYSGHSQQLDVNVARRGIEVRSLPSLTLATDPATAKLSRPSLRDMMTTPRIFRDLPLRAGAFAALAGEGEKIRVVIIAEPADPGVKLESAVAGLYDPDGKLVAQWTATAEELQRPTVMGAVSVPPGGYRVRVAATPATVKSSPRMRIDSPTGSTASNSFFATSAPMSTTLRRCRTSTSLTASPLTSR